MGARSPIGAALLLFCASCGSSSSSSSTDRADSGSPSQPGTVGAHVWSDTSTGIELRDVWFYDTFGPDAGPPRSGSSCWMLERSALTAAQLEALENMTLVPLTDACTADGYQYHELTVVGGDGSRSAYRDTGCSYLRVEGAAAMLPTTFFNSLLPLPTATDCPP